MCSNKCGIWITTTVLVLLTFSCTNDSTITQSSERNIGKTNDVYDVNSGDDPPRLSDLIRPNNNPNPSDPVCQISYEGIGRPDDDPYLAINSYDFRDNYLTKSNKGKDYTKYYYEISKYGIQNNLFSQHFKEHRELIHKSVGKANDLQYGNNNDQILIDKEIYYELKEMLELYRNHPKHTEIDPVLDYLEADLEKYYYKPKSVIALDFK